jgi:hypothetical protein
LTPGRAFNASDPSQSIWKRGGGRSNDAGLFLDGLGTEAAAMGWSAGELFDVPRAGRLGGLVWQLNRAGVEALGADHVRATDGRMILRGLASGGRVLAEQR